MSYFKALWRIISASMVNDMTYNYSGLKTAYLVNEKVVVNFTMDKLFYSLKGGEFW